MEAAWRVDVQESRSLGESTRKRVHDSRRSEQQRAWPSAQRLPRAGQEFQLTLEHEQRVDLAPVDVRLARLGDCVQRLLEHRNLVPAYAQEARAERLSLVRADENQLFHKAFIAAGPATVHRRPVVHLMGLGLRKSWLSEVSPIISNRGFIPLPLLELLEL